MGKLAVQKAEKSVKRSAVAAKPSAGMANPFSALTKFLHEVRIELTKVSWPNSQQVIASTIVVIVAVTFFALFIGGIDQVFVALIEWLAKIVKG